jgi:hypothetical protein
VFSNLLEYWTMDKVQKLSNSEFFPTVLQQHCSPSSLLLNGYMGSLPGDKAAEREANNSPPSNAEAAKTLRPTRLDSRKVGVRFPAGAGDISLFQNV